MPVQIGSIVSGLPHNLVDKIIEYERLPIRKLEERRGDVKIQLDLVKNLKDRLNKVNTGLMGLQDYRSFTDLKPVSSNPDILDATVDKDIAETGIYRMEVLQLAERSSAVSNGFPDKNETQIGVGFFNIDMPNGETKSIYIDSANNTLEGIANLVNKSKMGLKARVINDGSGSENPFRLAILGNESGNDGKMEFPTFYFLDGDQEFYLDRHENAKTARVKIDGFEVEFEDNVIKDYIPGVTIDLKRAQPGQIVTLKITKDSEKITAKVKEFIESVNSVLGFINQQNQMGKDTNTRQTLGGDQMLTMIEGRIRSVIQSQVPAATEEMQSLRLSDVGITFQRSGLVQMDEKKFQNALENNFEATANVFIGDRTSVGLTPRFKQVVAMSNERGRGVLSNREDGLQNRIDRFNKDIESKERLMEKRADNIRRKFAAMESALSQIKAQGGALGALAQAAPAGGNTNFGGATFTGGA